MRKIVIRVAGLVALSVLLTACALQEKNIPISPDSNAPQVNTAVSSYDKDGKLRPDALRVQFDVDADGRVRNTQILDSTTSPEIERRIISKMENEWRYEKGKPGKGIRVVLLKVHRIMAYPP